MLSVSLAAIALWNIALPLLNATPLKDAQWSITGIYSILSAWGFPLLIAGMGCCYLTESETYSTGFILTKRLPRALIGCIVWWLISTLTLMKYSRPDEIDIDTFFETMAKVLEPPYLAKFLILVVVFFAFYPLLKRIADDQKLTGYAVLVFAAISVLVPILRYIPYLKYVYLFAVQINWGFFTEFGLYLFLGIFLSRKTIEWHLRVVIYCAGILSTVAMYACTVWTYSEENGMDNSFICEASPFTALQTTAIIVLILSLVNKKRTEKASRIWKEIAQCSYAFIPMSAVLILVIDKTLSLDTLPTAGTIPIEMLIVLLSALAFSIVIRRLPVLSYFTI